MTEVRVSEESALVGRSLANIQMTADTEVVVVGLVRGNTPVAAPSSYEHLEAGDILIVEARTEDLKTFTNRLDLELVGDRDVTQEVLQSDAVHLVEAVVRTGSFMVGETVRSLNLRQQYGVNLLGISRQGARAHTRLGRVRIQAGDVLLLQGPRGMFGEVLSSLGALPLAERRLTLGRPRRILLSVGIFGAAIITAAVGLVPVEVAFIAASVAMIMTDLLTLGEVYESIDWSVIVLLGAMIPVGQALETSGGADLIANQVLRLAHAGISPVATLVLVLVGTMLLSNLVNNAAAAVLMAPIALTIANGLGAAADPFLMAVAIGASSAFLTPIGHQSNTLVMGPGGYRFGDYWRMGLPLQIIIVLAAVPLILRFWPL